MFIRVINTESKNNTCQNFYKTVMNYLSKHNSYAILFPKNFIRQLFKIIELLQKY
ncbi:hypothetical protein [Candidatus Walczuchella endosymbiont of Icerya purchasi]|uniref:hypothetical protein n=1 Tax=Candidatus Walczuchella endosymbiont of Icerya purchasi TaxID=3066219 RepID=UPI00313F3AA7